jgi:hypothetical protein
VVEIETEAGAEAVELTIRETVLAAESRAKMTMTTIQTPSLIVVVLQGGAVNPGGGTIASEFEAGRQWRAMMR